MSRKRHHPHKGGTTPTTEPKDRPGVVQFSVSEVVQFSMSLDKVLAAQQTPDSPSWFQGTADAVRQYRELIEAWDVDQLLILSGDQLYRMDYQAFIEAHRASGAALTVAALPVDAATAEGFGLMR